MAKPILVIWGEFNSESDVEHISNSAKKCCPDYNIILAKRRQEGISFEVLNVQDYPQIDFEELKAKLEAL